MYMFHHIESISFSVDRTNEGKEEEEEEEKGLINSIGLYANIDFLVCFLRLLLDYLSLIQ